MKYVITGGAGHISQPIAEALLESGHEVTVIGRDAFKLQPLVNKGAHTAVGSIEDASFVSNSFAGADAVYLMIPPNYTTADFLAYQKDVAKNFVEAIRQNGVKYVVVLSSIGAHLGSGTGPVDGLANLEKSLAELTDLNVKILRPSYFMYNLFGQVDLIKNIQIAGANFGGEDNKLALVHTRDIAAVAAEELLSLKFTGFSVRYIASDERTGTEIAKVLSAAVGKEGIPWVVFSDEQALEGMKQAGLSEDFAAMYAEMGHAIRAGKMQEDYWKNHPELGPTKLEDFAKEFAGAFNAVK